MADKQLEDVLNPSGNPEIHEQKIGTGDDYHEIRADGTVRLKGAARTWDDVFGRVISKNLDTAVGHWDWADGWFRADNSANATNNSHALFILFQIPHKTYVKKTFTGDAAPVFNFHIHWKQEQDHATNIPLWKAQYIITNTGGATDSTWKDLAVTNLNVFDYDNAGAQDQITEFASIDIEDMVVSSRIVVKLWRDGTDDADTYQQYLYASDFDGHVMDDSFGSDTLYGKAE